MRPGSVWGVLVLACVALACSEEPVPGPIRPVRAMLVVPALYALIYKVPSPDRAEL